MPKTQLARTPLRLQTHLKAAGRSNHVRRGKPRKVPPQIHLGTFAAARLGRLPGAQAQASPCKREAASAARRAGV